MLPGRALGRGWQQFSVTRPKLLDFKENRGKVLD
jgi:hypothetical protein